MLTIGGVVSGTVIRLPLLITSSFILILHSV